MQQAANRNLHGQAAERTFIAVFAFWRCRRLFHCCRLCCLVLHASFGACCSGLRRVQLFVAAAAQQSHAALCYDVLWLARLAVTWAEHGKVKSRRPVYGPVAAVVRAPAAFLIIVSRPVLTSQLQSVPHAVREPESDRVKIAHVFGPDSVNEIGNESVHQDKAQKRKEDAVVQHPV